MSEVKKLLLSGRMIGYLELYVMYVVLGIMLPVKHCTCSFYSRHSQVVGLQENCTKKKIL